MKKPKGPIFYVQENGVPYAGTIVILRVVPGVACLILRLF